jgi:hypothetical protein
MSTIASGNTTSTAVVITGDTTGNLVFTTQAGTNTLTVPNVTGTLLTNKTTGTILQVVQATYVGVASTTSTSFTNTSLTASITPSSSTNKILVFISSNGFSSSVSGASAYSINRGSTNIGSSQGFCVITNVVNTPFTIQFLDSPATTSSTTYNLAFKTNNAIYTAYYGDSNLTSVITLMEVAV